MCTYLTATESQVLVMMMNPLEPYHQLDLENMDGMKILDVLGFMDPINHVPFQQPLHLQFDEGFMDPPINIQKQQQQALVQGKMMTVALGPTLEDFEGMKMVDQLGFVEPINPDQKQAGEDQMTNGPAPGDRTLMLDQDSDNDVLEVRSVSSTGRPRVTWSGELHKRFAKAVNQLGGLFNAKPKRILKLMKVRGLSAISLQNYLQKLRNFVKQDMPQYCHNGYKLKKTNFIKWKKAAREKGVQMGATSTKTTSETTRSSSFEPFVRVNEDLEFEDDILGYADLLTNAEDNGVPNNANLEQNQIVGLVMTPENIPWVLEAEKDNADMVDDDELRRCLTLLGY